MATGLSQICAALVRDNHGDLISHVFKEIAEAGRARFSAIRKRTKLSVKELHTVLTVLVQQRLVTFQTGDTPHQTTYEANFVRAYALIKSGKIIHLLQERLGDNAATVFQRVMELGYVRIGDLMKECEHHDNESKLRSNGVANGSTNETADAGHTTTLADECHYQLMRLLRLGYLVPYNSKDTKSSYDLRMMAAEEIRAEPNSEFSGLITGVKQAAAFQHRISERVDGWEQQRGKHVKTHAVMARSQDHELNGTLETANAEIQRLSNGTDRANMIINRKPGKRKSNDLQSSQDAETEVETESRPVKKLRRSKNEDAEWLNGQSEATNGTNHVSASTAENHARLSTYDEHAHQQIDPHLILTCNFRRLELHMQTRQLAEYAERFLGPTTAAVYQAILEHVEGQVLVRQATDAAAAAMLNAAGVFDCIQVFRKLDANLDLSAGIVPPQTAHVKAEVDNIDWQRQIGVRDESDLAAIRANPVRHALFEQHLSLLCQDPRHFIKHIKLQTYVVELDRLVDSLIQTKIEDVIAIRFGADSMRIVRLLQAQGRMDEAQLTRLAFLRRTDMQTCLAKMYGAGYVAHQEVPREATRVSGKSIWLWQFNAHDCRELVLEKTYLTMVKLMQRISAERQKLSSLLDKVERTDVQGREEELLLPHELDKFKEWSRIEMQMLTQLMRQDELVALLTKFNDPRPAVVKES